MSSITEFASVAAFLALSILFVFASLWMSRRVQPRSKRSESQDTYECGEIAEGTAWVRFNVRFYLVALAFIVFDVEILLLFPIAVVLRPLAIAGLGLLALAETFVFVAILFVGYVYVLAKRDLDWTRTWLPENVPAFPRGKPAPGPAGGPAPAPAPPAPVAGAAPAAA